MLEKYLERVYDAEKIKVIIYETNSQGIVAIFNMSIGSIDTYDDEILVYGANNEFLTLSTEEVKEMEFENQIEILFGDRIGVVIID